MIKYVVQIICEQETCGSGRGLKCNTCKEMGTASHLYPFTFLSVTSSIIFFFCHQLMFKFIIRHLSDLTRPITALQQKQQEIIPHMKLKVQFSPFLHTFIEFLFYHCKDVCGWNSERVSVLQKCLGCQFSACQTKVIKS